MTQFTHSDDRIFTLVGTTPHTTRDGREVTLKLWQTSCSSPGCLNKITVKTATDKPNEWKNFQPKKFCHIHLAFAKQRDHARLVKARADGLRRWMASDEGKAVIKERERNKMGKIDRALYNAICDLSLTEEVILWVDAKQGAIDRLPPPKEGKRDFRKYVVSRSLTHLSIKGFVKQTEGVIVLLR